MANLRSPILDAHTGNCPVAGLLLLAAAGLIGPLYLLPSSFFYGVLIAAFALSVAGLFIVILRAARDIWLGGAHSASRLALAQFALGSLIVETQFAIIFGRGIMPTSSDEILWEVVVGGIGAAALLAFLAFAVWKTWRSAPANPLLDGRLWLIILETAAFVFMTLSASNDYFAAVFPFTLLLWVWQAAAAINVLKGRRHTAALIALTGWIAIAMLGWAMTFLPSINSFWKFDEAQRSYAEQARSRISSCADSSSLIAWHAEDIVLTDSGEARVEFQGYGWMRIPVDSAIVTGDACEPS